MTARILAGAALTLALSTGAFAQSYTAPAGIPAATAPGGLQGQAAARNFGAYEGRRTRYIPSDSAADAALTTGTVRATGERRGR